jgi:hypothetical protein
LSNNGGTFKTLGSVVNKAKEQLGASFPVRVSTSVDSTMDSPFKYDKNEAQFEDLYLLYKKLEEKKGSNADLIRQISDKTTKINEIKLSLKNIKDGTDELINAQNTQNLEKLEVSCHNHRVSACH